MSAVSLRNITVRFGTHTALNNVSFNAESGSFISVVGPNGGGKSTLIKLLLGLVSQESGTAEIFGKSPDKTPASKIGYVPQLKTLDRSFPALPVELVASGINGTWSTRLTTDEKRIAGEALDMVGVGHLAKRQLSKLSGGEMQKVYLARSIVRKPELLLLDEPATGIDSASEKDLSKLLEEYQKSTVSTVIMVTHDWEAAYHHSSSVLILNQSVICFENPDKAFHENNMRIAFGHIGHKHEMNFGVKDHD